MVNDFAKNFPKPSKEFVEIYLKIQENPIKYLLEDCMALIKEKNKGNIK
ncbi:MAG: hypothetical protein AABX29_00295 [Nanoarchaeota archaeon]